jgi:hypothetical protein
VSRPPRGAILPAQRMIPKIDRFRGSDALTSGIITRINCLDFQSDARSVNLLKLDRRAFAVPGSTGAEPLLVALRQRS